MLDVKHLPIGELKPSPRNARRHAKKQIRQLRGVDVLFKTDGERIKKYWLPNA